MQTLLSACPSANEASKRQTRVSASLQTNFFNQRANRSREETRKTDGGMAPTAGVSRSEAKVPENLRAVRDHGQSMQAQASRESGRSWPPRAWSYWESSASWNERRFRCPETGNISRRRAAGGAGLTTNQTAIHKAKGSARNIRALSARVMAQSERWRTCANTDVVLRLR